jgi:hypothetical protein
LIERMLAANPLWHAPRIHGELKMLGITISQRTVSRILRRLRRPPAQTWTTFLHNHLGQTVSIDFFTVPTITMKVLFAFIVLEHHRRQVLHFNVTGHPTAAWTARQIVEAFADRDAARYLIRDRDSIYGHDVRLRIASLGITVMNALQHNEMATDAFLANHKCRTAVMRSTNCLHRGAWSYPILSRCAILNIDGIRSRYFSRSGLPGSV